MVDDGSALAQLLPQNACSNLPAKPANSMAFLVSSSWKAFSGGAGGAAGQWYEAQLVCDERKMSVASPVYSSEAEGDDLIGEVSSPEKPRPNLSYLAILPKRFVRSLQHSSFDDIRATLRFSMASSWIRTVPNKPERGCQTRCRVTRLRLTIRLRAARCFI